MNIKNYKDYAWLDYPSKECKVYQLGDVVINNENDIGIIIQIHDCEEYRTDAFGNVSSSEIRMATDEEIQKYRPDILTPPNFNLKEFVKTEVKKIHKKTILENELKIVEKQLSLLKEEKSISEETKSYQSNVYENYRKDLEEIVKNLAEACNKLESAVLMQDQYIKNLPQVEARTDDGKRQKQIIIDIFKEVKKAKLSAERKIYEMN
ncbi:MAG: hypothetical protein WC466_08635 [Candidatus Izemoplasmatales bacterium]